MGLVSIEQRGETASQEGSLSEPQKSQALHALERLIERTLNTNLELLGIDKAKLDARSQQDIQAAMNEEEAAREVGISDILRATLVLDKKTGKRRAATSWDDEGEKAINRNFNRRIKGMSKKEMQEIADTRVYNVINSIPSIPDATTRYLSNSLPHGGRYERFIGGNGRAIVYKVGHRFSPNEVKTQVRGFGLAVYIWREALASIQEAIFR